MEGQQRRAQKGQNMTDRWSREIRKGERFILFYAALPVLRRKPRTWLKTDKTHKPSSKKWKKSETHLFPFYSILDLFHPTSFYVRHHFIRRHLFEFTPSFLFGIPRGVFVDNTFEEEFRFADPGLGSVGILGEKPKAGPEASSCEMGNLG
jgi:hypothetical protein